MARPQSFDLSSVLQRSLDIFWEKGYASVSIDDLTKATGLSRSSLYNEFGDKHGLFSRALIQYEQQMVATVESILNQQVPIRTRLEHLLDALITEALSDEKRRGCMLTNAAVEKAAQFGDVTYILHANRKLLESLFKNAFVEAQLKGELNPTANADGLAQLLFMLLQGLRVVSKFENKASDLQLVKRQAMLLLQS